MKAKTEQKNKPKLPFEKKWHQTVGQKTKLTTFAECDVL